MYEHVKLSALRRLVGEVENAALLRDAEYMRQLEKRASSIAAGRVNVQRSREGRTQSQSSGRGRSYSHSRSRSRGRGQSPGSAARTPSRGRS